MFISPFLSSMYFNDLEDEFYLFEGSTGVDIGMVRLFIICNYTIILSDTA